MARIRKTSWGNVKSWYSNTQDQDGDYFHKELIFPELLRILKLDNQSTVLDIACGEGVFSRVIPKVKKYIGFDIANGLIAAAKDKNRLNNSEFFVQDASGAIALPQADFTHVVCVLALQNIENTVGVFKNASLLLKDGGTFAIVINHPYFRIPKSTSWGLDYERNIQYRRVDRYLSDHAVGIDMTPGSTDYKKMTTSFHRPLSYYVEKLSKSNFAVTGIEEWVSPKVSEGRYALMENRARNEIPLFMCIIARKLSVSL